MLKELLLVHPRNERGFWGKVTRGKAGFVRLSLPTVAALTPPDWKVTIHDARAKPVDFDLLVETVRDYYQNGYRPELCLQNRPRDCFASASLPPQLSRVN